MRTKSVVKWGAVAIMVFAAVTAWIVATSEHISRHEYKWQRDKEGFRQDDFKPGEYRRMRG